MATTPSWLYARRRPWHGCVAHPSLGDEPEFWRLFSITRRIDALADRIVPASLFFSYGTMRVRLMTRDRASGARSD